MPKMSQDQIDEMMGMGKTENPNIRPLTSSQPLLEPTKQPFHKNPWFKISACGSGLFILFWFFSQAFAGPSTTTSQGTATQATLVSDDQDLAARLAKIEAENSNLRANLALNQQIQDQAVPPKPTPTPSPIATQPIPARAAEPPRPQRYYARPIQAPSRPVYQRPYSPPPRQAAPMPLRAYPTYTGAPVQEQDPMRQWQQQAGMTFVAPGGNQGSPVAYQPPVTPQNYASNNQPPSQPRANVPTSPLPGVPLAGETVAAGPTEGRLEMDSRARATLRNDVVWASQSNQPLQDQIVLVLSEPLRNRAGVGVIPQGALVVARVDKLFQGGLFTANVEEFHLPDGKQIRVPAGAIILQQRNRGALQAKLVRPGRGAGAVLARIGLGGLNSAVGAIAQGNTSSYYGNGYSSFNQRSNPLASGISGMTGQALNQVNQSTQQQFQGQGNVALYQLGSGAKVDLYVKQDVNL